jgi:hypothetical protein
MDSCTTIADMASMNSCMMMIFEFKVRFARPGLHFRPSKPKKEWSISIEFYRSWATLYDRVLHADAGGT